jgi:FdhD protein
MDAEGGRDIQETVVCERPVTIRLCGVPIVRVNCLPARLEDLAVGFLFSEGILDDPDSLSAASLSDDGATVDVKAGIDTTQLADIHRRVVLTSGCGKGAAMDDLKALMDCGRRFDLTFSVQKERVLELMRDFQSRSVLFRASGGVHAAALAEGTHLLDFAEDVGRHNAVDKVIGRAIRERRPVRCNLLLTTGRMTVDIVAKAARVGIPILVSPSAPTDRAIELAGAVQMALLGFVRGRRMNIYSAAFRVAG